MISQKKLSGPEGIGKKYSMSWKSRDLQPRLLYLAKLSFIIEVQIKSFLDKKKLKEFIITKTLLYKIQKGLIYKKEEDQNY